MARFVIAACLALFLFHGARAETVQDVEALMAQADKVWGTKFAYIEERLIKALEIAERLTGPSSATTEAVVNKRGRNAFNAGWYPLAERMFRRDVVLSIALHGDSVPAARAMGDLAAALREQCKLDEASEQILDSIAMRRRILPPKDYAWLASGYDNLSKIRELQHRDDDAIAAHGHIPLPPYIRRGDEANDRERYQTVFARAAGAVAAETADARAVVVVRARAAARAASNPPPTIRGATQPKPTKLHRHFTFVGSSSTARR